MADSANRSTVMSDGIERDDGLRIPVGSESVGATRYSPADEDGPLPALLMFYPYRKDDHLTFGAYTPTIEYLALQKYEVVVADIVGTGSSTGKKTEPLDTMGEGKQGAEIVEWLAERDWTTGSIGMFGKSYPGLMCLATAAHDPDSLEAIVPIHTSIGGYRYRNGGVHNAYNLGGHWHTQMQALQALPSSYRDEEGAFIEAWKDHLEQLETGTPWMFQRLHHEHKDEFYDGKAVDTSQITVPTLAVSGWRDIGTAATLEYYEAIQGETRVLMGPWRHTMPHRGRETAIDFRRQVADWFDYFLKKEETGALDRPPITFWTERDGGGVANAGVWRPADRWPDARETGEDTLTFTLSPDGLENEEAFTDGSVDVVYDHDYTVGMHSLDELDVPIDTTEDDNRSLCFETDQLENPVELTGTPTATIRLESTIPDPLLVVRVVDVAPDGQGNLVTHGRLRASHRKGHDSPDTLVPDEEYQITVPLKPKSHVFEPGHRIRVAISGAYFPFALPTRQAGSFRVISNSEDPSKIQLPGRIHDGNVAFEETISMDEPTTDVQPVDSVYIDRTDSSFTTSRDHYNDTATVTTVADKHVDLPHGGSMEFAQTIECSVTADDPSTMVVTSRTDMTVDYGQEEGHATVRCRHSRDSTQLSNRVTLGGEVVFEKTWRS